MALAGRNRAREIKAHYSIFTHRAIVEAAQRHGLERMGNVEMQPAGQEGAVGWALLQQEAPCSHSDPLASTYQQLFRTTAVVAI